MARVHFWSRLLPTLLLLGAAFVFSFGWQSRVVVQAGVVEQLPASTDATTHVLSYQGRLVDPTTGAPKADGSYSMTFRIYDAASGGTTLWTEIKDVTVSKGLFSTLLGDTTALPSTHFDGNDRWLGVKVGVDPETTPRMRMAFAPYASYALNTGTLGGQDSAFYRNAANLNAGTLADDRLDVLITRDSEVIGIVTAADGAGSELDADLLDGMNSSDFLGSSKGTMASASANPVLSVKQSGTDPNHGVAGLFSSTESYAVQGDTVSSSSGIAGVRGTAGLSGVTLRLKSGLLGESDTGWGVVGSSQDNSGVFGWSTNDYAIEGQGPSTASGGVKGTSFGSSTGRGVYGLTTATSGETYGVFGESNSTSYGAGVRGEGPYVGLWGVSTNSDGGWGGYVVSSGTHGIGLGGWASGTGGRSIYGYTPGTGGHAGYFAGNVHVTGYLSKSSGTFKIDHPLDPANKYLSHSFVESPDMMNVYNGNVTLGEDGSAWVDLPAYFQALNRDFRYQLTPIGGPGPNLYIAQEVQNNRFQIAGGGAGLRVSWQVTGIRQDAFANANPVIVEQEKPENEKGTYLHPELFGQDRSRGLDYKLNNMPFDGPEARPRSQEEAMPLPALANP